MIILQIVTFGKLALYNCFSTPEFQVCCVLQVLPKSKNGFIIWRHWERNSDNMNISVSDRESFAIVLTGKLHLSKSVQTNKSVAEDQPIGNNQIIFRKVVTGSYSVLYCILWIANCERNIKQVDTESSLTDDVWMC